MASAPDTIVHTTPPLQNLHLLEARLQRWVHFLIGVTTALAPFLIGLAVFFSLNVVTPTVEPTNDQGTGEIKTPEPPPVSAPLSPNALSSATRERYHEAIGSLIASHLYQSYLNIGLLADAVEKEGYQPEEAKKMLKSVNELMTVTERQLNKLADAGMEPSDRDALDRIKAVMGLLRLQTQKLSIYWETGDRVHADQYQRAREAAWKSLNRVVGFETP